MGLHVSGEPRPTGLAGLTHRLHHFNAIALPALERFGVSERRRCARAEVELDLAERTPLAPHRLDERPNRADSRPRSDKDHIASARLLDGESSTHRPGNANHRPERRGAESIAKRGATFNQEFEQI